ncbi:sinapine esterase isoform X3 [Spinacia oleracea]|uniref:Sinapine esterase isoform X3 n=1 Tax=Spinacia oleracea TaxID=3562 RepID=A0ABM3R9X9_SPIOL|nr:sinapine esterase-like isoform X3 [Spinacia oleracea]
MVARVSIILPLSLVVALILCFATVALSSTFTDDNPIRVVSDGPHDFQSSDVFTNIVDIHDDDDDDDDAPILPRSNIKAIYQFGDSISDTGNLIHENPTFKYARLPYGISFFQIPTGRPSNGLLMIDYFKCKEKLGKSLIMMGEIGGNDYNSVLFGKTSMLKAYDLVPEVVQVIKYVIKEVIKLGAIRIVVPGNFPVGCMAINLALYKTNDSRMYDELQCLKHLNQFAEFQNNKLQQAIRELQKDHPHVTIVYADYFSAFKEIIKHATSLGFDKDATMKVCCGVGENEYNFDMNRQCGSDGVVACEHPNQRIFWDGIHLTQHAYRIMANWLIKYNFDPIFSMT